MNACKERQRNLNLHHKKENMYLNVNIVVFIILFDKCLTLRTLLQRYTEKNQSNSSNKTGNSLLINIFHSDRYFKMYRKLKNI